MGFLKYHGRFASAHCAKFLIALRSPDFSARFPSLRCSACFVAGFIPKSGERPAAPCRPLIPRTSRPNRSPDKSPINSNYTQHSYLFARRHKPRTSPLDSSHPQSANISPAPPPYSDNPHSQPGRSPNPFPLLGPPSRIFFPLLIHRIPAILSTIHTSIHPVGCACKTLGSSRLLAEVKTPK